MAIPDSAARADLDHDDTVLEASSVRNGSFDQLLLRDL